MMTVHFTLTWIDWQEALKCTWKDLGSLALALHVPPANVAVNQLVLMSCSFLSKLFLIKLTVFSVILAMDDDDALLVPCFLFSFNLVMKKFVFHQPSWRFCAHLVEVQRQPCSFSMNVKLSNFCISCDSVKCILDLVSLIGMLHSCNVFVLHSVFFWVTGTINSTPIFTNWEGQHLCCRWPNDCLPAVLGKKWQFSEVVTSKCTDLRLFSGICGCFDLQTSHASLVMILRFFFYKTEAGWYLLKRLVECTHSSKYQHPDRL